MIIDAASERSEQGRFRSKSPDSSNAVLGDTAQGRLTAGPGAYDRTNSLNAGIAASKAAMFRAVITIRGIDRPRGMYATISCTPFALLMNRRTSTAMPPVV